MYILNRLEEAWRMQGISSSGGVTRAAIEEFEARNRLVLPELFREYLRTLNGMVAGKVDHYLIAFLPLNVVDTPKCMLAANGNVDIIIAEFSLWSHFYALQLECRQHENGVIASDGENIKRLSSSFSDFLEGYLASPADVANCLLRTH